MSAERRRRRRLRRPRTAAIGLQRQQRHAHITSEALSHCALSLSVDARSLSLSRHSEVRSLFLPISHSLSLPLVLFCANCLQHFLNASWSQHLKHFNLLLLSRSTLLLSHAPSSRSHSFSLSVCLQSLLSFCKNGCLCCACSLSVGVVVVAVGRNTVELEQQFAAI